MVFASNVFIFLYLPLFLAIYYLSSPQLRSSVIVIASYIFYAWWRPDFLGIFIAITLWNYVLGLSINRQLEKKHRSTAFKLLWLGITGNLATLFYFKYANFGAEALSIILQPFGFDTLTLEHILLPLGISFYVFHALSYIVDVYRREAVPTRNFIDFAAFVALFPHLVAGPILRYRQMAPQLAQRQHSLELFSLGACRFMLGFIMKVLIADNLAGISGIYLQQRQLSFSESWFGLLASSFQLYFDFAGYSGMAIGLALMIGFRFPENFNQPWTSQSVTEFWQRWHMTLAHFLRDYVYMPLVRKRLAGPLPALIYTMVLSGLWHGASFAFICWGLFFGISMVIERRLGIATKITSRYRLWRNIANMIFINLSMPLFFTNDLVHSLKIYAAMIGLNGLGNLDIYQFGASRLGILFVFVAMTWLILAGRNNVRFYANQGNAYFMQRVTGLNSVFIWLGFSLAMTSLAANSFTPFLYFQF